MSIKAKARALALATALAAIAAAGAPGAQADVFESDEPDSTVLTGQSTSIHAFAVWAIAAGCTSTTFKATVMGSTAEELTVHPKYFGCATSLEDNATIDTDGCNYVLDTATDEGHAAFAIECEENHKIKITSEIGCTITLGPQSGLQGVVYENEDPGATDQEAVVVHATVTGMHYTTNVICQLAGGTATDTDGVYEGKVTVKGYEDDGPPTGSVTEGLKYVEGSQVGIRVNDTR